MFALAFYFSYLILSKIYRKENVSIHLLNKLAIFVFIETLAGARLGHTLFYEFGYYKLQNPIAEINSFRFRAQVYSSQLSFIDKGEQAIIRFPDLKDKEIGGKIEFVNPEINPETRINLVRATVPNTRNQLKPGMSAYMVIKAVNTNLYPYLPMLLSAIIKEHQFGYRSRVINSNTKWWRLAWKVRIVLKSNQA